MCCWSGQCRSLIVFIFVHWPMFTLLITDLKKMSSTWIESDWFGLFIYSEKSVLWPVYCNWNFLFSLLWTIKSAILTLRNVNVIHLNVQEEEEICRISIFCSDSVLLGKVRTKCQKSIYFKNWIRNNYQNEKACGFLWFSGWKYVRPDLKN